MSVNLILGGARSGKSSFAESLTAVPRTYIATAQALDSEMHDRIAVHQRRRGTAWKTIEEPIELSRVLRSLRHEPGFILVDCLTLWLSNLMMANMDVSWELDQLLEVLAGMRAETILVSNEVGLGIVPESALGREFRDLQGTANQRVASVSNLVILMVAGIPMVLKGQLPTLRSWQEE